MNTTPVDYEKFTILSFCENRSGTKDASFKPYAIQRDWDGEVFTINDEITNGTQMRGNIIGFEFLENKVFVNHTWSGIGMNLGSIVKIPVLPSTFQIDQVVEVAFKKGSEPINATVRGIHFYRGKVKYDLGLWLGDGSVDDPETETRIYNIDSIYVRMAK
jgi:hypothetical protein